MRGLLALIGLAILVVVVLMYFGIININQTRPAVVQAPAFQAELPKVSLGNKTVEVPTISVQKPGATPSPTAQ